MMPTNKRAQISNAFEFEGEYFLFDCGENTQLQIKKKKLPIGKIRKIFISHWHGDHTIGLNGLLQTLSNTQGVSNVEIYGPKGSKKFVKNIINSSIFSPKYKLKVFELNPKKNSVLSVLKTDKYEIKTALLDHSVLCLGYLFEEMGVLNIKKDSLKIKDIKVLDFVRLKKGLDVKINNKLFRNEDLTYKKDGLKICFIFDTRPCNGINLLSKNCNFMLSEATYLDKDKIKAEENDHMSSSEVSKIAKKNDVECLILTHFSQRYKDTKELLKESKKFLKNVIVAEDLMTIDLSPKKI